MSPILAFSTLLGPPEPALLLLKTNPSTNSVSSIVPLHEEKQHIVKMNQRWLVERFQKNLTFYGGKYALLQQRSDKPDKQSNTDKG